MSTRFCVFRLTGFSHTLILHSQIRGTWKRQAGPVEDAQPARFDFTKPARVLNKKTEREGWLRARAIGAESAVRLRDTHRPTAEHWRFVALFSSDRGAVVEKDGC